MKDSSVRRCLRTTPGLAALLSGCRGSDGQRERLWDHGARYTWGV